MFRTLVLFSLGGALWAQPLLVQNQQTGLDQVTFVLSNPRSVPVTAYQVTVTVMFSDGYSTKLQGAAEDYFSPTPPVAAGGTRSEQFSLPTRLDSTAAVSSVVVTVDATVYDDGTSAGDSKVIARIFDQRRLDVRETKRTLDRLVHARQAADPAADLAQAGAADMPSKDARIQTHQHDFQTIVATLKATGPDKRSAALDGIISIMGARLARAQRAVQP